MAAPPAVGETKNYFARFGTLAWLSLAQLVRSPSHSRRAEAARRAARHVLWLSAGLGAAIIVLMYAIDAWEIAQMPKRGTPSLWWLRILTDFGKDEYVLAVLAGLLVAVAIVSPALRGIQRSLLLGLGTRLQFIFCAVAFSNLVTEVLKYCIGRGRPFVGGEANAFHFSHFAGNPAYYSFPSGHATTAFALALAVSAVWPQARVAMAIYALIIAASRLVLLAHHPSDVVAGAMVGIVGAMSVRYWFAARRLGFAIQRDGSIVSLVGPSSGRLKRVARGAFAP
jgi:membrane-associated phospholipid phosphatase